jgi:tryptophan synthase alpha chain
VSERIAAAFAAARGESRAALMPYMMGGFPDQATAGAISKAYVEGGADLIELGVPFSDPLADGPVIHDAATRALGAGATLERILQTCAALSERVPVVIMCYANMVFARGAEGFAAELEEAGAAGLIVPDLTVDESDEVHAALSGTGLALIPLVAPTTSPERRREICRAAEGFVYVVALRGVTGERDELHGELAELVSAVRNEAEVPAAVGFGIGTPEQAAEVGRIADGVIIGSRLVREAGDAPDAGSAAAAVTSFLREIRAAMG